MAFYVSSRNFIALFILFFTIVLPSHSSLVKRSTGGCGEWCYDEEEKYLECDTPVRWIDHDCITGERQSPIDIPVGRITASSDIFLSSHYSNPSKFELVNNGHTAAINPLNSKDLIMTGSNFNGSYVVAGLHFHWGENNKIGSEHKLSGESFTMELHIVHHKTQYADLDDALASDDPSSVAVLGVFFQVADDSDSENDDLQNIIDLLETVEETEKSTLGVDLKVSDLIPSKSEIFNYQGSLTTPCCNQNVFWTIFKTPLSVSSKQMTAFRHLKYHNGHYLQNNYRGPQPLNNRSILQTYATVRIADKSSSPPTPTMPIFLIGFSLTSFFVSYFSSLIGVAK